MDNQLWPEDPKRKGGFFKLPKQDVCRHPEHNPPSHMVIPQGQGYHHICPSCGSEATIVPPQISL